MNCAVQDYYNNLIYFGTTVIISPQDYCNNFPYFETTVIILLTLFSISPNWPSKKKINIIKKLTF